MRLPKNPQPLERADLYGAVFDFIDKYCLPSLNGEIYRGDQNRISLPPHNNFAIMKIIGTPKRGTIEEHFTKETGKLEHIQLVRCFMQIDFYGPEASRRADTIQVLFSTGTACDFLEPYGISPLYAEEPKDLTKVDGSHQFVERYMTVLHMTYNARIEQTVDSFSRVKLNTEVIQ